jgi:hypothetical protein
MKIPAADLKGPYLDQLMKDKCDIVEYTGSQPLPGMYKMIEKPAALCAAQDQAAHNSATRRREGMRERDANLSGLDERRYGVTGGIRSYERSRGGRRGYEDSRPSRFNPDRYYGGNSETKDDKKEDKLPAGAAQAGGKRKSKKSKKSRRVVDYGSMMLYGGKSRKSKKSKKSRK